MHKKLILASGSPRRKELLGRTGFSFEVLVSDVEEAVTGTDPSAVTEELSRQKAEAVAEELLSASGGRSGASVGALWIVLGADTVVALDGKILGKPEDRADAVRMIHSLQGRSHEVYTGVTLISKDEKGVQRHTFSVGTKVTVAPMTDEEIEWYVDTGECMDKAGAYGIQGTFGCFIEGIEGDYSNVVGLPVHAVYQALKEYDI